jgi:hypothetical protein
MTSQPLQCLGHRHSRTCGRSSARCHRSQTGLCTWRRINGVHPTAAAAAPASAAADVHDNSIAQVHYKSIRCSHMRDGSPTHNGPAPAARAQLQLLAGSNTAAGGAARQSAEEGAVSKGLVQERRLRLSARGQLSALSCRVDERHDELNFGRSVRHFAPRDAVFFKSFGHADAGAADRCGQG